MQKSEHPRSQPAFKTNLLLEALPPASRTALLVHIEYVSLSTGHVLYRPFEVPRYVHFLTSGLASIAILLATGDEIEVGIVGSEGMVEALHLLGPSEVSTEALIQVKATAMRVPFTEVQKEFQWADCLRDLVLHQIRDQTLTATQLVACNALHSVDTRLARWLLMIADRVATNKLQITHKFLAEMVAARRPTVTLALGRLEQSGVVRSSRAAVEILDRLQLESMACECYPVLRRLNVQGRNAGYSTKHG